MTLPDGLLVGWYGDDFTGSVAVMEVLTFAGLPSVLFLEPPTPEQKASFANVRGLGIASTARTRSPEWMQSHLPQNFAFLASLQPQILHYKVCSTLDSSPKVGSIGAAIDCALSVLDSEWVPILLAAPTLRRYQAFGHLFASAPDGVFRLDRHPIMSRHPVTPMDESDVALHISKQTSLPIGLLHLEDLTSPEAADSALNRLLAQSRKLVSLDTVDRRNLAEVGRLLWERRSVGLFAVGSQGIEYALVEHWQLPSTKPSHAGAATKIVAISGSVSAITAKQIAWGLANGFVGIPFNPCAVLTGDTESEISRVVHAAEQTEGDTLIYTAQGADDPQVQAFRASQTAMGVSGEEALRRLGEALGEVLVRSLQATGARRAVVFGGDTSGFVTQRLGVYALTALAPIAPGAALCRVHSEDPYFDGLELALKGGQMGSEDYLGKVKQGGIG